MVHMEKICPTARDCQIYAQIDLDKDFVLR